MSQESRFIKGSATGSDNRLPAPVSFLLALTYLASSLSLPFMLSYKDGALTVVSYAVLVLCAAVLYISARKTAHAVLLVFLMVFLSSFVGSPVLPAFIFGIIIGTAAASTLFASRSRLGLTLILCSALGAYVLCLAVCEDPLVSVFSLALFFPAFFLSVATGKKSGLTSSVALCGGMLTLSALAVLIYRMHYLYGSVSLESLGLASDSFVDAFVYYVNYALSELSELEVTAAVRGEILAVAESYVNLSPGLLVAATLILAYFIHSTQRNLFYAYGMDSVMPTETILLTVSVPAAIVFLIAYIISFATSASGGISIAAVVGNNISIMLTPCLILKGITALKVIPLKLGFWGVLIVGGIIFFLLSTPSFLSVLALIGAFFVLTVNIDRWAKDHFGKGENK